MVYDWADTYQMYKPHNFKFWPDDELWKLLFAEYTNYFAGTARPFLSRSRSSTSSRPTCSG
jgi:hypothetical protein